MMRLGVSRENRSIGRLVPELILGQLLLAVCLLTCFSIELRAQADLQCGMQRVDVTPEVKADRPVWLAGYGWGRKATGVHDPLFATCVALSDGTKRLALVTVDVVGLQLPTVEEVRNQLKGFDYVLISSTHNHEGPDTIGIWGNTPVQRGVDDAYLDQVVMRIVEGVRQAEKRMQPVRAAYGTATDETLLGDSRKPRVKDGVLRVLRMERIDDGELAGLIVQWNCHPEAMGPDNTLITADFPWATIDRLQKEFSCPIAYFTGAIGGLMAPPDDVIRDEQGKMLGEGDFEYARCYGEAVANLASRAIREAQTITLVPFGLASQRVAMPVQNSLYRTASLMGIVRRPRTVWTGDYRAIQPVTRPMLPSELAIVTEVAYLRLGELSMAAIPGELYPELVYGQFQDPVEPNVDFPDAPLEKTIAQLMPDERWMLFGLANDEIGYIIPRRQWDQAAPFAYGRDRAQYGEVNSCGPDVAPIVMQALADCIQNTAEP
jgi:hypothetical protein